MKIIHYDLFAGIGGFSYAIDQVYGKENTKHIFVEIDPFCQAVLKKHWPEGEYWGDIREFILDLQSGISIIELCQQNYVHIAKKSQEHTIQIGEENASQKQQEKDYTEVQRDAKDISKESEKLQQDYGNKLLKRMGGNVPVAEKKNHHSLPLTISTEEEQKKEKNIVAYNSIECCGIVDSPRGIKSFATTAITGSIDLENVRIRKNEKEKTITILTAGVPCQPASQAGKRRGKKDDRWLWPETFAVIRKLKPDWCILENVRGLLTLERGLVFEELCLELEGCGYSLQTLIIPAVAVNAPHRRDRVWIIAYHSSKGLEGKIYKERQGSRYDTNAPNPRCKRQTKQQKQTERSEQCDFNAPNSTSKRLCGGCEKQTEQERRKDISGTNTDAQNSIGKRRGGRGKDGRQILERQSTETKNERPSSQDWERDWKEVAFATCFRGMDDGLSRRMVRLPDGTKISYAKWRQEGLKAFGNAIVPQVAIEILKAIRSLEPN